MQRFRTTALVLTSTLALTAGLASGVEAGTAGLDNQRTTQEDPRTVTLAKLSKRIQADFSDLPAEDVFDFIADVTNTDIVVTYESDVDPEGIDPEQLINFKARNQPALTVLDRLIRNLNTALSPSSPYAWQMGEDGSYQIGPKDALDRETRTEIYDIGDLLFEVPHFDNAPEFELQSSSGGQGGGTSAIQGGGGQDEERLTHQQRLDKLINIITTIVEPNSWVSAGGSSATITAYQSTLIVSAPDYVHRALSGYDFWPSSLQSQRYTDGQKETHIRPKPSSPRKGP